MSNTKQVLRKLLQDHVGEQHAITQSKLAEATGTNPSTLRSELRRLREERQIPIANLRDGYFVIKDKDELSEFVGHVNSEIQSKRNTIEHTLEAFESFDRENMEIEQEPEQEAVEPTYDCAKCESEVPKSKAKWPKSGPYEDQVVCSHCFGGLVMEGQA